MSKLDEELPAPYFDALDDRVGISIVDPVESARFELWTPERVDPEEADPSPFAFPLDSAVIVETDRIEIPKLADLMIRDPEGNYLGRYSTADDRAAFEQRRYNVELTTTPMKLYLLVDAPVEISRTDRTSVVIDFGWKTEVRVGARSFAERPVGTVTITDDETDLLKAVSLFGAALKTTSPERSFPTLRGHPPRIERGEEYSVTRGVESVDTGVKLVVPAERQAIFTVAPLAFYLGAKLIEGDEPRLVARGVDRVLPDPMRPPAWDREMGRFERAINRLLQQVFFFDCLTRTEGLYQFDLHERTSFEADLGAKYDLDFAYLYDQSIPTQLDAYLSVPFEKIRSYLPTWNLLVDLVATPEQDALLPYVASDLPLIRTTPPPEKRTPRPTDDYSTEVLGLKGGDWPRVNADNPDVHDRSLVGHDFDPLDAPTVEHAYAGDGYPLGSNKLQLDGFENQLGVPRTDAESITVRLVVADSTLEEYDNLFHVWNDRNLLNFEISRLQEPNKRLLREALEEPCDFLHYVGEVTDEGVAYSDGILDWREVHDFGPKAFFVQSCTDYDDVSWMFARGAYAGIVSTTPIEDLRQGDDYLVMGRWIARALNEGFTLRSAATIAEQAISHPIDYTILGDGSLSIIHTDGAYPKFVDVEELDDVKCKLTIETYPNRKWQMGGVDKIVTMDKSHLPPKKFPPIELDHDETREFLSSEVVPMNYHGEYLWSDEPW